MVKKCTCFNKCNITINGSIHKLNICKECFRKYLISNKFYYDRNNIFVKSKNKKLVQIVTIFNSIIPKTPICDLSKYNIKQCYFKFTKSIHMIDNNHDYILPESYTSCINQIYNSIINIDIEIGLIMNIISDSTHIQFYLG